MTDLRTERRPIPGYEGLYEVDANGNVFSLTRRVPGRRGVVQGRRRAPFITRQGYQRIRLWKNGEGRAWFVHHLVLGAFVGPRPDGWVGCHNDGNPANNHISNLRWDTYSGNAADCLKHGNHTQANKTHCPRNHPYDEANTGIRPNGSRICRECARQRAQLRREAIRCGEDLLAPLCEVTGLSLDELPTPPPETEAQAAQISHVAETHDPETGRSQPLQRRCR